MSDTAPPIDWSAVPVDYMADGMRRYFERGIPPGSFLTALLSNDLIETYRCADENNRRHIEEWVRFLYNRMPVHPLRCHGSPGIVDAWIAAGGWAGAAGDDSEPARGTSHE